ncbi:hypothetical protein Clacol_001909 [Clathrus columnatus]|uniref:NAD(P)-binding protein n=1 Tax=Clathrus columnatus TaxID=1419009 RepID=A0AAV5A4L7_9AGAM|nr:hypothetical protein Clacol_001909 [Clathrus columnatus]
MLPYVLITPSSRGLSLALARYYLQNTNYAVVATHRSADEQIIRHRILRTDSDAGTERTNNSNGNDSRLTLLPLELTSEESIASAANQLAARLPPDAHLHTAWITGGVLHTEKRPQDIDYDTLINSFKINVISHLLIIKHFSRFLPEYSGNSPSRSAHQNLTRWVHISARLGSISDNRSGGWYSYRSSKAALNQIIKTFDIQLQTQSRTHSKNHPATICVGVQPGTVKTELSKSFWGEDSKGRHDPELMEPKEAAHKLVNVVSNLTEGQRGRIWDWAGRLVEW